MAKCSRKLRGQEYLFAGCALEAVHAGSAQRSRCSGFVSSISHACLFEKEAGTSKYNRPELFSGVAPWNPRSWVPSTPTFIQDGVLHTLVWTWIQFLAVAPSITCVRYTEKDKSDRRTIEMVGTRTPNCTRYRSVFELGSCHTCNLTPFAHPQPHVATMQCLFRLEMTISLTRQIVPKQRRRPDRSQSP